MIDLSPLARRLAGTPLAEWANTLQAQLDGLKQEKKALMQQLLTGKRRVKLADPAH